MTAAQLNLLAILSSRERGSFLHGVDVRVARRLCQQGYVTIDDNGPLSPYGHSDRERWFVEITDKGRAEIAKLARR